MANIDGWQIFLGILAFISIVQIVMPFVESIQLKNGGLSGIVTLGIIVYLLFKKWEV